MALAPGAAEGHIWRERPGFLMDATSHAAIAVDHLVKRYKAATAVDGITFHIAPGSVTGLLGGNGAG